MKTMNQYTRRKAGFTLIELLVVIAMVAVISALLLPGMANTKSPNLTAYCMNNQRQLAVAFKMYGDDHKDLLLAANSSMPLRVNWMSGGLNFTAGNLSNFDINTDINKSPMWQYVRKNEKVFKCPADLSMVTDLASRRVPRVRSVSMNTAFGSGSWLDGFGTSGGGAYRLYAKGAEIVNPAMTFVFTDEHPDSINDGGLSVQCKNAQPSDPPLSEQIIDFPASFHAGACGFSFADGRAEMHKWAGSRIQPRVDFTGTMPLNVPANPDSGVDVRWLAEHTTVKK